MIHVIKVLKVNSLKVTILFVAVFILGCKNKYIYSSDDLKNKTYQAINIDMLEKNSLEYDNMLIEIQGYFYMDIENIYIHNNNNQNRIWLDFNFFKPLVSKESDTLNGKKLISFNKKKVTVKGIYKVDKTGHLGVYNGGITNITFFGNN